VKTGEATSGRSVVRLVAPWASLLTIAAIDHLTGPDFGFFVFYFVPIAMAAWWSGLVAGGVVSFAAAATWWLVSLPGQAPPTLHPVWNAGIRLVAFLAIASTMARIRELVVGQQRLNAELKDALANVRRLEGLLPICGACKKIRNDAGQWERLESYLSRHSHAEFSHGLCPGCSQRLDPQPPEPAAPSR